MLNWKSKQLSHEGFPLLLRYPEWLHADSDKALFPELAVVMRKSFWTNEFKRRAF